MNGHIKLLWYWNNILLFEKVMFLDTYYTKVNYSVQVYMPLLMPNLVCIIQKSFTNSDLNRSTKCTTFMKTCKEL